MKTWPIGTRVITPPIRNGEPLTTETTCAPFGWSGGVYVTLAGLPGLYETRLLRVAPVEPTASELALAAARGLE